MRGDNFYFSICKDIKEGLTLKEICHKHKLSKQALNWYIHALKASGIIEKVGYGVWKQVKAFDKDTLRGVPKLYKEGIPKKKKNIAIKEYKSDTIRGHAFQWIVKLPVIKKWNKRQVYLNQKGIKNTPLKNHSGVYGQEIFIKGFRVWLCKETLIIWQPKGVSWFANKASEAYKYALYDLKEHIIKGLENSLNIKVSQNGRYDFRTVKLENALIKNALAEQYNRDGDKLRVYGLEDGKGWLSIDASEPEYQLGELEGIHPDVQTNVRDVDVVVQPFFNKLRQRPKILEEHDNDINDIKALTKTLKEYIEISKPQTMDEAFKDKPLRSNKDLRSYIG